MMPIRGCLLGLIFFGLALQSASPAFSQNQSPDNNSETTVFKSSVRVVLVDVVVTNGKDEPITGLPKDDFQIIEDGHPQALSSFDEHSGLPDLPALAIQAKLPPNVFSNLPLAKTGDAANLLLLDALNTPLADQSYVHSQMIKYIKGIKPGTRLAIFTLGTKLRFVQGFTGDPTVLMAAVNGQKSAGNPQLSPLLQTSTEIDADQRITSQMQEMASSSGSAQIAASAAALQEFQQETISFQTDIRVHTTLEAMQQLARYLVGIPGRKNVIWFSGSFPLSIFGSFTVGGSDPMRAYGGEVAKTANMLAAAQVAIYPIGAQGVGVDRQYDMSGPLPPKIASATAEQQMIQYQTHDLQAGSIDRNAGFAAMDELAKDTGGEALYNTNGLSEALERVLNDGTHYYTLTYSPSNKNMDGGLRHIEVKLNGAKYHLAYRRGYYATNEIVRAPGTPRAATGDPLRALMDHGTPDSTEILYAMYVRPSSPQPASDAAHAGDNGSLKGPVKRYAVTFTVSPEHLTLEPGPDGVRHGSLEATLVGYDRDGKALNWMVRVLQLSVPPDRYAAVQAKGFPFNLEIDVPTDDVYLRSGVYDQGSSKAGTLEIPLAAVSAQASATK